MTHRSARLLPAVVALPLGIYLAAPATAATSSTPTPAASSSPTSSSPTGPSTPSNAPTPTAPPGCTTPAAHPAVTLRGPALINAGDAVTVTATVTDGQPADLLLTRVQPYPTLPVRSSTAVTTVSWQLRLGQTHTLKVQSRRHNCDFTDSPGDPTLVIAARPIISLTAQRNADRDYTFAGTVTPARRQLVTLYRVNQGKPVIVQQVHLDQAGRYSLRRAFTGTGRFDFYTSIPGSGTNTAGKSNTRPTLIY